MCFGHKKNAWTIKGEPIDISACVSLRDAKETIGRHLNLAPAELLLLCGREALSGDEAYRRIMAKNSVGADDANGKQQQLRVVHRPSAPSYLFLRYAYLAVYFLVVVWYTYWDTTPSGLLSTLFMVIGFRWTNRRAWQRMFPPPPPTKTPTSPSHNKEGLCPIEEHLVVCPLYNESEEYLAPMLSALITAQRTWPLTVLFATEMAMEEQWLQQATRRLEQAGIAVVTVRHPSRLLHEVPGAASNVNWALEIFCFESKKHPSRYLLTKCDSNGVVDTGYFLQLEGYAKFFQGEAFFVQPKICMEYTGQWNWIDSVLHRRLRRAMRVGEGGLTHFSFPLAQFLAVGRYSHSSVVVLDDSDCYLQQESLGVHFVEPPTQTIRKVIPGSSDMAQRMSSKWVPQAFGTAAVTMSFRRSLLYPFRLCGGILYFEKIVVCIKLARILRDCYLWQ